MPRVSRQPFVQWQAPLVWTTLTLAMHADGHADFAMTGASPFPRHWIYDGAGQLASKSGLTDFSDWMTGLSGPQHSPWGDEDSPALVTAVETALERTLSVQLMHGGQKPKVTHLKAGDTMVRQGEVGSDLYLVLDGVIRVDRDGEQLAEYGPGALLGERSRLEHGTRTSTLIAVIPCRVPPCRPLSSTSRRSPSSPAVTGAKKPCRTASCGSTCAGPRTNPGPPGRDFALKQSTSCLAIRPDGRAVPELPLDADTGIRKVTALRGRPCLSTIAQIGLHRDQVQGLPLFTGDDARVSLLLAGPEGIGSRFGAGS